MVAKYTYNTFHDTRGYYAVHEIQVPVEERGKGGEGGRGQRISSEYFTRHRNAGGGVAHADLSMHKISRRILRHSQGKWEWAVASKKEEKRKRLQGQRREGEKKWKEERGGEIEKLRGRGKNCGTNGMEGERDGSQGSHARGSRVKKLRNGIEFETCLRGSGEWRRCVPLPHSCIILAFVLTGYPASASGGWGGKPPRLLQPAFPASRHALSREESLGPRFLVLDSHFSYHFAYCLRDYSPRKISPPHFRN